MSGIPSTRPKKHNVPPPRYASGSDANDIIGHPRQSHSDPRMPRIGSSHTIPSVLHCWTWLTGTISYPPVVVLVRDIRAAMGSHYVKWQDRIAEPFSAYVRGDPSGQRYKADLWWYIRFFNRWGDLAQANPSKILVVRYEELQVEPELCLRRIAAHWRLDLGDEAFAEALRFVDREAIRSLLDPEDTEIAVPPDGASSSVIYSRADDAFVNNTLSRYLRHDFRYGYANGGPVTQNELRSAVRTSL
jgi:hypothetical protein